MAAEGRAQPGPGAREPRSAVPHRRPNKDAGGTAARAQPGWSGAEGKRWQVCSFRAAGRRHHGRGWGSPDPPHAGKRPPPRRSPRHRPRAPSRPPGPPAPAPARGGGAGKPGAPRGGRGRGGGESWVRVCFVLPGWLRAHPRGRTSWPGEPGPPRPRSGRPGAAPRCARRVPPRASARAQRLGLSFLRPPARSPARSLAPGAWIDLVALASGSRSRPASTPRLPILGALARPPARSLTRAPARHRRPTRDPLQIPGPAGVSAEPAPPPPPPAPRPACSKEKTLLPLPP